VHVPVHDRRAGHSAQGAGMVNAQIFFDRTPTTNLNAGLPLHLERYLHTPQPLQPHTAQDKSTATMSDTGSKAGPEPSERTAIGVTFGNSNSSIAYLVDDKAEVIANEDGGEHACCATCRPLGRLLILCCSRPPDPHHSVVRRRRRVLRPAGQELPRQEPPEHSRLLPRLPRERVQVDRPYAQPRLGPPPRKRRDRFLHPQGQGGRGGRTLDLACL